MTTEFGTPDLLITQTANTEWREIKENLRPGERYVDRPELVCRVFKQKSDALRHDVCDLHYFGRCIAWVYVIEFQKRGLPHMHLIVWLASKFKLTNDTVDKFISAELPNQKNTRLFEIVSTKMIHTPCNGTDDYGRFCRVKDKKKCDKDFPKPFNKRSNLENEDGYPIYRRREDGNTFIVKRQIIQNRDAVSEQQGRLQESLNAEDKQYKENVNRTKKVTKLIKSLSMKDDDDENDDYNAKKKATPKEDPKKLPQPVMDALLEDDDDVDDFDEEEEVL